MDPLPFVVALHRDNTCHRFPRSFCLVIRNKISNFICESKHNCIHYIYTPWTLDTPAQTCIWSCKELCFIISIETMHTIYCLSIHNMYMPEIYVYLHVENLSEIYVYMSLQYCTTQCDSDKKHMSVLPVSIVYCQINLFQNKYQLESQGIKQETEQVKKAERLRKPYKLYMSFSLY